MQKTKRVLARKRKNKRVTTMRMRWRMIMML
jgi:hypothetical protein